jgi:predicted MPP superfamily phosphohydrolase
MASKKHLSDTLWDAWCILSIIGIWPRFIEPNTLSTTRHTLEINKFPKELNKLRILQFSDLHLNPDISDHFLNKVIRSIKQLNPDIIVFTGDFLCYARFNDKERLKNFFCSLPQARYGNYAVLGNHDYAEYALVNDQGDYDISRKASGESIITKGLKRLFGDLKVTGNFKKEALQTPLNQELVDMIAATPFKLLHNESVKISVDDSFLNICGLGEYMLGRCKPEEAYQNYDARYPGIILVHNPDAVPYLEGYPGELILCGHTHGGQINLPWVWRKFVVMEDFSLVKGLKRRKNRWVYINRGLGSVMNFRWFCTPEISHFELIGQQ